MKADSRWQNTVNPWGQRYWGESTLSHRLFFHELYLALTEKIRRSPKKYPLCCRPRVGEQQLCTRGRTTTKIFLFYLHYRIKFLQEYKLSYSRINSKLSIKKVVESVFKMFQKLSRPRWFHRKILILYSIFKKIEKKHFSIHSMRLTLL